MAYVLAILGFVAAGAGAIALGSIILSPAPIASKDDVELMLGISLLFFMGAIYLKLRGRGVI